KLVASFGSLTPLALLFALATAACDQGDSELDQAHGPPLRVLAMHPYANQGLDCNTQDSACGVPTNTSLLIRLDRFIDPATAIRQSVIVDRGTDPTLILSAPEYDVVERVLIYRLGTLLPMATYSVEILIPTEEAPDGLR